MNKFARMVVQDKLSRDSARVSSRDNAGYDAAGSDRDRAMRDGYRDGFRDGYDQANYEIRGQYDKEDGEWDGARRRSKITGRYMRDRGESVELTPQDMMHWEKKLRNADGTKGKHFDAHHVNEAASKLGIRFDEYSEKELCMAMNMLYSDLCEALHSVIPPEKEAYYYAKIAQAWLEDDDGPTPSEKLALYFYCIADDE